MGKRRQNVYFTVVITKNSKTTKEMESISKSDFKERFRDKGKITETEITLKGIPFRAGVILHENGKRYGFRTTIPKENTPDIKVIAGFIPARWRQENKFEELKNGENGDKIARYEFINAPNIHLQNKYEELQKDNAKKEKNEEIVGGKMEPGRTEFLTESEQGLIAIENIDADICIICGSEYLPAESDNYIEICLRYGQINNRYFSHPPPSRLTLAGCPSRSAPPALVVWGRRFSIIPVGFGCEVGFDRIYRIYRILMLPRIL